MNKSLEKFKKTVEAINYEYATLHTLTNDELRMRYFYLEQFVNEQKEGHPHNSVAKKVK